MSGAIFLSASVVSFFSGLEIDRDSCESSSIATNVSNSLRVLSALCVQFSIFQSILEIPRHISARCANVFPEKRRRRLTALDSESWKSSFDCTPGVF